MKPICILVILLQFAILSPLALRAQGYTFYGDKKGLAEAERITYLIYHARHQQVEKELEQLKQLMPAGHPVPTLLRALNLYWKDAPMHTNSPHFQEFIKLLELSISQSENFLDKKTDQTVCTFTTLTAHSLLARYHSEKGEYMAALKEARYTYAYMKEGFKLKEEYKEFFFPTGLYNYYRVKYPEVNPVYKPFMWMFQEGNKTLGLQQLEYAVRHNVFTKAEAAVFLVHLYLYYENNPKKAIENIQILYRDFPENRYIRLLLAESLISAGLYADAAPHVTYLLQQTSPYYRAAGELFSGLLQEKQQANHQRAYDHYQAALNTARSLNNIADTYRSMAYAGMARYYESTRQDAKAQTAWKQALELALYEYPVKQEAKTRLK